MQDSDSDVGAARSMVATCDEDTLDLGTSQDISGAAALKDMLQAMLAREGDVCLDGARIERIDTAALQVIGALAKALASSQRSMRWAGVSDVLSRAVVTTGLGALLRIETKNAD
jgi:phospholipid transport system transporter-binding protein